jgi:hypothetical protein
MAVDVDQFQIDFPQFANTDTDLIDSAIATAMLMADTTAWGGLATRAQSLLTAHMLALQSQAAATDGRNTGNLTGISIPNEVSMSYSNTATAATANSGDSGLKATTYGQEFLQLRQFKFVPFMIA